MSVKLSLQRVWSGRYPAYWDVTPWVTWANGYLFACYRDEKTRGRFIESIEVASGRSTRIPTVCNLVLGSIEWRVYLARIEDARSHLSVTRLTSYDILDSSMSILNQDTFLVEKFKIPPLTEATESEFRLGNQLVDLQTGHSLSNTGKPAWTIGDGYELFQQQQTLCCLDNNQNLMWSKSGWMGSWFQGASNEILYFLVPPYDTLVLVDRNSGQLLAEHTMTNLKKVANRVGGCLDVWNTASFNSTTVFDVAINGYTVAWVTEDNRLHVQNLQTGLSACSEPGEFDLLLSSWWKQSLVLYEVQDDGMRGRLVIVRWEEL
ncbi:hypothetical protein [Tumebacillus permanentifrigoris]|nr:hypothetical protein [Tumebacillus permanentifrigoris]